MKEINRLNAEFDLPLEDEKGVCGIKIPPKETVIQQVKENWKGAYETAARTINDSETKIPVTPPKVHWQAAKEHVCAVVGPVRFVCQ